MRCWKHAIVRFAVCGTKTAFAILSNDGNMRLPVSQLYSMTWNANATPAYAVISNSSHRHYFLACFTPLFTRQLTIGPLLLSPIFCQALIFAGLAAAVLMAPLRVVGRARQIQMACGAHLLLPYINLWQPDLKLQNIYMLSLHL